MSSGLLWICIEYSCDSCWEILLKSKHAKSRCSENHEHLYQMSCQSIHQLSSYLSLDQTDQLTSDSSIPGARLPPRIRVTNPTKWLHRGECCGTSILPKCSLMGQYGINLWCFGFFKQSAVLPSGQTCPVTPNSNRLKEDSGAKNSINEPTVKKGNNLALQKSITAIIKHLNNVNVKFLWRSDNSPPVTMKELLIAKGLLKSCVFCLFVLLGRG